MKGKLEHIDYRDREHALCLHQYDNLEIKDNK